MVVCARVCVLVVCVVCAVCVCLWCVCGVCVAFGCGEGGNREVDMEPGARLIKIN